MKHLSFGPAWSIVLAWALVMIPGSVGLNAQLRPVPVSQRQMLQQVRTQLQFLETSTRNVPMFKNAADATLWRQFQGVAAAFEDFKRSLNPAQLDRGANDLAELDAGLAIISEAFPNFQADLEQGRSGNEALRTLCQVLRDATKLWEKQLDEVARRLRITG